LRGGNCPARISPDLLHYLIASDTRSVRYACQKVAKAASISPRGAGFEDRVL